MTRYQIIINPVAGRGSANRYLPQIEEKLKSLNLDYQVTLTEYPWHAAEISQRAVAEGFDVVVAAGGDGTSNEVLNGLMLAKNAGLGSACMGVLCIGRGNDFAFSMGIPTHWEAGCETLAKNHRRPFDVGYVVGGLYPEGRYFGNGVGVGFDTVVGFEAVKLTHLHGFPSYIVAALRTIYLYFDAPTVQIELDGETITQPALLVSLMNGRRMGGGFMMAPESLSDDGLFDLCITGKISRLGVFALIPRFMKGSQKGHPAVQFKRSRKVDIKAIQGTLPAHADGETLCTRGDQLTLEILPRCLELVCDPEGLS